MPLADHSTPGPLADHSTPGLLTVSPGLLTVFSLPRFGSTPAGKAAGAGYVEDTGLPKGVMFRELVAEGTGCAGGQEKKWVECFLDDLGAFGINFDQWTTAAQDRGDGARLGNKGRKFHGEMDRCRDGLGWTTACSSMNEASVLVLVRST